jgi:Fe2+ or Zn2+ uptake regulation protein
MPTKRETALSNRHQIWTPEQVADLLAEYRADFAQAAKQHHLHLPHEMVICTACGQVDTYNSPRLLHFARHVEGGEVFK